MRNRKKMESGKEFKKRFKNYLNLEIVIDYKTCTYFFCVWFFYCAYLLCQKIHWANIFYMFEMMAASYLISYVQVYVFHNFDEASQLRKKDIPGIICCSGLYIALSYGFRWFDRNYMATLLFGVYVPATYYVMYLANKIKRAIDTDNLNKMLEDFKKGETYDA